jgi:CRP/FNR family transcriptional regulator, cyclic AMP receptor protein
MVANAGRSAVKLTRDTVALLDVDPDAGRNLTPEELEAASQRAVARTATLPAGRRDGVWGPPAADDHLGLMVVDGLLLREVEVGRSIAAELLGPPDIVRPWDGDGAGGLGPVSVRWTMLGEVTVAVLDDAFVRRAATWPALLSGLAARGISRANCLTVYQAISNLKRIDQRLLMLFWQLADRFGRVSGGQILIDLPLTHEILSRLIGARRPSVTTALGVLREQGLVSRRQDGVWVLDRAAGERLLVA